MAYTKQNFVDGNTLSAEQLNNIEDGVAQNETEIQKLKKIDPDMNLLVLGDSLFASVNGKAFLQTIGCKIENCSTGGATLSEISERKRIDGTFNTIYDQLIYFRAKVAAEISAGIAPGEGELAFHEPDMILIDGGGNDYIYAAVMGTLNPYPSHYLRGTYDYTTVMGGLERLLHFVTFYYPKAQRFFLVMHRVLQCTSETLIKGTRRYWPTNYCNVRVPYTRVENGSTVTTWELLFNQNNEALTSASDVIAAEGLKVKVFSETDTDDNGYVDFTAAVYNKSDLYVNGDMSGSLDTSKFEGHYFYNTLRENIIKACQMYGVKVIDIFNDSCINLIPLNKVTPVTNGGYWYIGSVNTKIKESQALIADEIYVANLDYFDWNGVHPTALGYEIGYRPHIVNALRLATKKG